MNNVQKGQNAISPKPEQSLLMNPSQNNTVLDGRLPNVMSPNLPPNESEQIYMQRVQARDSEHYAGSNVMNWRELNHPKQVMSPNNPYMPNGPTVMGSQLQLHKMNNHPHYQSHQSLLMIPPPSMTPNNAGSFTPGPGVMTSNQMFHSGTLPIGPSFIRQPQIHPGMHLASRTSTPANGLEMTELYQQHAVQQNPYSFHQPSMSLMSVRTEFYTIVFSD